MTVTRELEEVSPEAALEILALSNRSPSNDSGVISDAQVYVDNSTADDAAFGEDILIVNGYIVEGYDKLSAIAVGNKSVKAWVVRENTFSLEQM